VSQLFDLHFAHTTSSVSADQNMGGRQDRTRLTMPKFPFRHGVQSTEVCRSKNSICLSPQSLTKIYVHSPKQYAIFTQQLVCVWMVPYIHRTNLYDEKAELSSGPTSRQIGGFTRRFTVVVNPAISWQVETDSVKWNRSHWLKIPADEIPLLQNLSRFTGVNECIHSCQ